MKKIFCIVSVNLLIACSGNFIKVNDDFMNSFNYGNYPLATDIMIKNTQNIEKDSTNVYLGGLQCGVSALWGNDFESEQLCFDNSQKVLSGELEEQSSYKIKNYEYIMLKNYEAIRELGTEDSHINQTLKQAYALQVDNVQENDEEITEAQEKIAENASSLEGFPSMTEIINAVNEEMVTQEDSVVALKDYVNPYVTYLSALWDSLNGDKVNGFNYLERVKKFVPDNKYVSSDQESINSNKEYVWVFFENGLVGEIKKRSLAPQILQAFNIKVTIPDVYPGVKALQTLDVSTTDGSVIQTQFLANIDSIVKTDLEKYKTGNIIKSLAFEIGKVAVATGAGVAVGHVANKHGNSGLGLLAGTLTAAAVMSAEKPWDLRSWNSLPNEVQVARLEMPKDRILIIDNFGVEIPNNIKNAAVFVRLPQANAFPGIVVGKFN